MNPPENPAILSRPLGAPGSIAHALLGADDPGFLPLARHLAATPPPPSRRSRLGPDAFGVSGPGVRARLESVLRGQGTFVTTGHQPVLLLGPLYVLYKALTAISLAARLERAVGAPVVPLFWIASDDHDWAEVGSATLLDRADAPRTLALPVPSGGERRSVGSHVLRGPEMEVLDALSEIVPESEFTAHYLELVRDACAEGRPVSAAFARLLLGVLGDRGYAWIDSARPEVRRAAAPLYRQLLADWDGTVEAEAAGAHALRASGFEPPIPPVDDALPLFFDEGAGRHRVRRDGTAPPEIWLERLDAAPEGFSPNVASRPALESHLFPVAATVLGPGEIAYWSQLGPLFDALDVPLPSIQPRAAWTLVEARTRRILERTGLSPQDLATGAEPVVERLTREARPEGVERALDRFSEEAEAGMAAIEAAVAEDVPGLRGAAGKMRKGIFDAASELSRQVDRATRERLDVRLGQVRRAAANLFPRRRPQERVLNPLSFLCRYGPGLVERLARETDRQVASFLAGRAEDG
ncbi:MAG: bacillithiol biosynthesis cysteine-adding enzyme BshC [Gemmatimonadota bacterium]|uniref:bacillithiol biosynthesis cysteine-adding enzyme BshC n=1 Tax=Candidatus Palauibacter scopulicola TaxID=3056741 RepID=UPI00239B6067|nr:bacillithiol biosynthesis cysteine-adding enzyme BshC [Candidatus Palauibacter scopulicola]MDE2662859.1 bacillithiol biosynthesis cysteine-adding enzyme BshC [Candidatus Palauibacter scopulicola]